MSEIRVAARYAKSLLALAKEKNVVERVSEDMEFFARTCEENRQLMVTLKSPVVKHQQKLGILRAIFQSRVSPTTFTIFDIITHKNREGILYAIAKEFHRQYNAYQNVQPATVTTTFPLDDTMRAQFVQMVTDQTGKRVELTEKIDPALIGGFVLQVGDQQRDESIRSGLQSLKLAFLQN